MSGRMSDVEESWFRDGWAEEHVNPIHKDCAADVRLVLAQLDASRKREKELEDAARERIAALEGSREAWIQVNLSRIAALEAEVGLLRELEDDVRVHVLNHMDATNLSYALQSIDQFRKEQEKK